jgi:hypothetical protein
MPWTNTRPPSSIGGKNVTITGVRRQLHTGRFTFVTMMASQEKAGEKECINVLAAALTERVR